MNVALLKKIKARILAKPNAFRMDRWSCGTAHCIAGWACVLNGVKPTKLYVGAADRSVTPDGTYVETRAADLLGLESADLGGNAERLFYEYEWPARFRSDPTVGRKLKAKRAAARIDHFIATGGAE